MRPSKGTPTSLNMYVFDQELTKGGGIIHQMEVTAIPHMRRIINAGYVEPVPGAKRGVWRASPLGIEALMQWRAEERARGRVMGRVSRRRTSARR
jgi:hypothetical protein